MKIVCAWCGKDMGEKEGEGIEGISHSVCEECADKLVLEMKRLLEIERGAENSESTEDN